MSNRVILGIWLLIIGLPFACVGQDPHFSRYSVFDTYLNPAHVHNNIVSDIKGQVDLQFRDQWNRISKGDNYNTIKFLADYNLFSGDLDAWNIGVLFLNDRSNESILKHTNFRINGTYTRLLSGNLYRNRDKHIISFGGSYGFNQYNFNIGNLWFGRQFDINTTQIDRLIDSGETFNFNDNNYNNLNLGARYVFQLNESEIYTASFGIDQIIQNFQNTQTNNFDFRRFTFIAEAQMRLSDHVLHKPFVGMMFQGPYFQIVPGYHVMVGIESEDDAFYQLKAGFAPRITKNIEGILVDAIIFNLALSAKTWKIELNLDMVTSDKRSFTGQNGSIELSLSYFLIEE